MRRSIAKPTVTTRILCLAILLLPFPGHAGEFTLSVDGPATELPEGAMPPGLLQKARGGDRDAQWDLGVLYIEYDVITAEGRRNPAAYWLLRAAEQDHVWATNEVGMGYLDGENGFEEDFSKALHWLTKSATLGDELAAFNLARVHSGRYDISINDETAHFWLSKAARRGVKPALFELAFRLGEGVGTEKDPALKAEQLASLRLAGYDLPAYLRDEGFYLLDLNLGDIEAWFEPGELTADEQVARLLTVFDTFQTTHRDGKTGGQLTIGDDVVNMSLAIARGWARDMLSIAARLGNRDAQLRLSEYHLQGEWVVKSERLSEYWRKRAEAQS